MTCQPDFTLPAELLEQIASQGFDFIPELVRIVVNTAMQAERENHLGVKPYQRSNERQGYANDIGKAGASSAATSCPKGRNLEETKPGQLRSGQIYA